jgi:hypothetical protein
MLENALDAVAYEAVAKAVNADFAYSYLIRAKQLGGKTIRPHTVVAWERLTQSPPTMHALKANGYRLVKPERWYQGRDGGPVQMDRAA